ncbi:MAG: DUF4160 domain-containing protein [Fermentimonas sp.]|nr:DUF4160 domain-containing protein [Fermentimonas sp.]
MTRKSRIKLEYLLDSLRLLLAEEEDEEVVDINLLNSGDIEVKGYKRVCVMIITIPFIFVMVLFQLPFLLISNLVILIKAIIYGIPIQIVYPIIGAAKEVDRVDNNIKIEIRHKEHPPPHFHVIIDNEDCSFDIITGSRLKGIFTQKKYYKRIDRWFIKNRKILIRFWNETRPSDCPVGHISDYGKY